MSWERFVETRIPEKVGMAHSTVRHGDAASGGDVATTHPLLERKQRVIAPMTSDNTK